MKLEKIRAAIVIQYDYHDFKAITTNLGGNPAYTGALLNAKYQNIFEVEKLLKEGDLVYLAEKLYPKQYQRHEYIIYHAKDYRNYLQPRTTCSLYRDVIAMSKGRPVEIDKISAEKYRTLYELANERQVRCLYVYNVAESRWYTYRKVSKYKVEKQNVDYTRYILNLLYSKEIRNFTKDNKEWLKEHGMDIYY
ncbi:hypothetical protein SAMN02745136_00514 [Anaerocolumna jejuensis DSM 15929]|uniref:Uncharacterized protein n=1 Tax=Anaerocolumna jejuensis DSM 15929 TaxID=1121322 RepID=A0A1M6KN95_9FIRM|nr:hypothetical protein [Anaerocolumna jejuensis]SHJ60344.1 hypothetical protein SAMN02745136_00514 [Anaerocolumna jejuensis DSM 15929]